MPGTALAEIYFITAMMIIILIVCGLAVYYFFKTYNKEMRQKEQARAQKKAAADANKAVDESLGHN